MFDLLSCHPRRRYRHSFPTRRSSDRPRERLDRLLGEEERRRRRVLRAEGDHRLEHAAAPEPHRRTPRGGDRKSTRLNSSHLGISYAVFCVKKKNKETALTAVALINPL